jgi:hypothetical protein
MWSIAFPTLFSRPTSHSWQFSDFHPSKARRGTGLLLTLVAWIATADLLWPRTNVAILYIIPLVVAALLGLFDRLWLFAALLLVLTLAIYWLKNSLLAGDDDLVSQLWNYRLLNRVLTAVTIAALTWSLGNWSRWVEEQRDPELSAADRNSEYEIAATVAVLCCVPLITTIAIIDLLMPANYNLAILYPIPLFICGWTRSRRLLWTVFLVLIALTVFAYQIGPIPSVETEEFSLIRNRIVAGFGLLALTALLSFWMRFHADEVS